jgi:rubrerythrin
MTTIQTFLYFDFTIYTATKRKATMKFESGDLAICEVCGMQYDVPLTEAPKSCPICDVSDVTRSPRTRQN